MKLTKNPLKSKVEGAPSPNFLFFFFSPSTSDTAAIVPLFLFTPSSFTAFTTSPVFSFSFSSSSSAMVGCKTILELPFRDFSGRLELDAVLLLLLSLELSSVEWGLDFSRTELGVMLILGILMGAVDDDDEVAEGLGSLAEGAGASVGSTDLARLFFAGRTSSSDAEPEPEPSAYDVGCLEPARARRACTI